LHNNKCYYIG